MLDSPMVRVHQHAAGQKKHGPSRGPWPRGLSTKLHAAVDALGDPMGSVLTPGQQADITQAETLVSSYVVDAVIVDKGYVQTPL